MSSPHRWTFAIALLLAFVVGAPASYATGSPGSPASPGPAQPAAASATTAAPDPASPARNSTPSPAPPADSNAQLRSEIDDLKQLVLQQQARISALEREHAAQGNPAVTGLLTDLSSPAVSPYGNGVAPESPDPTQAQQQPAGPVQQALQNAGSSDERVRNLERRIKGLGPLSLSGDVRVREEPWFGGPNNGSLDRARVRVRARLNAVADLGEDFAAGFSFASGDINDPTSTNQTLGQFYTRKAFSLDQAWVTYKPSYYKPLSLVAGKFRYPWYNTELTWDKDLNPEGAAETLAYQLDIPVLKRIAFVGFQLPFAEEAYNSSTSQNIVQSMTYGGQVQTMFQIAPHVTLSAYSGYYDYLNPNTIAQALARASTKNPQTPFSGYLPLTLGSTDQNSITTTVATNVVTIAGKTYATGVTSIYNAQYGSGFGLFDNIARLDWDTGHAKWPLAFIGDYVQNTKACGDVGNILPAPANTAAVTYKQTTNFPCVSNQRRGYWLEARAGRLLEKRDWQFGYTRIYIEREAVLSNFNYSDMLQGSNVSEHRFDTFFMLQKNVQLGFTALIGRPLGLVNGQTQPWLYRLQFDTIYFF